MPCLEITMPQTTNAVKQRLAEQLSQALAQALGMDQSILGLRFVEYGPNEAAIGGQLWEGSGDAPYLHLLLYCPRLRRTVKQSVVSALTDAFVKSTGQATWQPIIHLCEHPYDNVGVEGRLLSDTYEECANRVFYYPLPND